MAELYGSRQKKINHIVWAFICVMVYKFTLEIGFWYLLKGAYERLPVYRFNFSGINFILGSACVIVIFFFLDYNNERPSMFFLKLHYLIAIVPMSVIAAFSSESLSYYFLTVLSFVLAVLIVELGGKIKIPSVTITTKLIIIIFYIITVIVYLGIIKENGMFTLEAVNIYKVYDVRNQFEINKYIGYMFSWQYTVINPFFIIRFLQNKNYIKCIAFIILQTISYLYTGQKTILLILPLVLGVYIISKIKRFSVWFLTAVTSAVAIFTFGGFISKNLYNLFDLLVRRALLLPANLKFLYFDYFEAHKTMGFANTLWGKFLDSYQPYKEGIGFRISGEYFNWPSVNSNTGFIAEGVYRFGSIGIVIVFILLAVILLFIDHFSDLNGNSFAVCISLFSIFLLNDGALIDTVIFGNLTILIIVCLFYNSKYDTILSHGNSG